MKFKDVIIAEEKVRLDPKCWTGKKIGNPKTKMKGGVRVNNCVPAESVAEDDAGDVEQRFAAKMEKEKQRLAKLKQTDPEEYKREMEKRKTSSRVPPVSTFEDQGVAEGSNDWSGPLYDPALQGNGKKQRYEMMFKNGQVKRFSALNDNEARKIAAGHSAKSVIRMKGNVPSNKIKEQGVAEGLKDTVKQKAKQFGKYMTEPQGPQQELVRNRAKNIDKIRKNKEQGVAEGFNGEYNDEAGMAQGNLYTIAQAAQGLLDTIDDRDNLPEWAQEKIAKVEGMLVTVWNYLQSQKAQGIDPQVDEGEVKPFVIPDDQVQGNYENQGYRKSPQDRFAVIDYTFNKLILTTNDIKQAKQEAIEWAEYDDIPVAVKNQQTNKVVFKLNGYADAEKYLDESVDREIAEMYEAMQNLVSEMAQKTNVSEDVVWETFEALDDNMLYETAAWQKKSGKNKNGGLNAKGVASYRREHPGSKLQTAVTTKPSKLKPGSKAAKRRKSFCARMSGVKGPMKKPNGKPTRKALALRKWNC